MCHDAFCVSCRLNETIPDLSIAHNRALWGLIEAAKRRLVYSLMEQRLPLENRADNPRGGLGFRFLANTNNTPTAAYDADPDRPRGRHHHAEHRGGRRSLPGKNPAGDERAVPHARRPFPARDRPLLLGPHRVATRSILDGFRRLFGDERGDYDGALRNYYATGAPRDWQNHFISIYSTAHPWEDWAETWAHYLHIHDTLEVASDFGLISKRLRLDNRPDPGRLVAGAPKQKELRRDHRRVGAAFGRAQQHQPQHGAARHLSLRAVEGRGGKTALHLRCHRGQPGAGRLAGRQLAFLVFVDGGATFGPAHRFQLKAEAFRGLPGPCRTSGRRRSRRSCFPGRHPPSCGFDSRLVLAGARLHRRRGAAFRCRARGGGPGRLRPAAMRTRIRPPSVHLRRPAPPLVTAAAIRHPAVPIHGRVDLRGRPRTPRPTSRPIRCRRTFRWKSREKSKPA